MSRKTLQPRSLQIPIFANGETCYSYIDQNRLFILQGIVLRNHFPFVVEVHNCLRRWSKKALRMRSFFNAEQLVRGGMEGEEEDDIRRHDWCAWSGARLTHFERITGNPNRKLEWSRKSKMRLIIDNRNNNTTFRSSKSNVPVVWTDLPRPVWSSRSCDWSLSSASSPWSWWLR